MAGDPKAPHGRDDQGVPLAPYGLNLDGTPRKSNRGRSRPAGPGKPAAKPSMTSTASNLTDVQRKGMLHELAMTMLVSPLATLSRVPLVKRYLGEKQADGLAGDAFILAQVAPGVIDGVILLSKTKPGMLAWMDKMEENAPYVVLASAVLQGVKAIAANHLNPSPHLADAGRNLAMMHMEAMAAAVNEQASQMRARAQASAYPEPEPADASWGPPEGFDAEATQQFARAA